MKPNPNHLSDVELLSNEFCKLLSVDIGDDNLRQAVARNRSNPDPLVCHSHDFCDANMDMFEAFVNVFEREPDLQGPDVRLINKAWDLAKESDFNL